MLKRLLALAAVIIATPAMAQTLLSTQRVHVVPITFPDRPYHNLEVAMDLNPVGPEIAVAWIHAYGQGSFVFDSEIQYNVSTDGVTFDPAAFSALPNVPHLRGQPGGSDPSVAFAKTGGTYWIESLDNRLLNGVYVCRKLAGQSMTTQHVVLDSSSGVDKPWLSYGPDLSTGNPALYLTCAHGTTWEVPSTTDLGVNWTLPGSQALPPPPTVGGGGPSATVIQNGSAAGRRLIASQGNSNPGVLQYLDSSGWHYSNPLPTQATKRDGSGFEDISSTPSLVTFGPQGGTEGLVAMAVDPRLNATNTHDVYLAFSGTAGSSGGSNNIDLFIARSTDGGTSFSPTQVLHLLDSDFDSATVKHQITPTIVIDPYGGVNVAFWEATLVNGTSWTYQVRYARIASFNALNPSIVQFTLAATFNIDVAGFALQVNSLGQPNWHTGDYMAAAARGCYVYIAFMSRHENTVMSVYVSTIEVSNTCALADMDGNGLVTTDDASAFARSYMSNNPRADLTRDGTIDGQDTILFTESYSCGCRP